MYFPKRDELSLRVVFAFPNASSIGLVARICLSISLESSKENFVFDFALESGGFTDARYRMMNLAYKISERDVFKAIRKHTDSVFPAPLEC